MVIDLTSFVWLCVVKLSCNFALGIKPLAFFLRIFVKRVYCDRQAIPKADM